MNLQVVTNDKTVLCNDNGKVYLRFVGLFDIYYGVSSLPFLTVDTIINNFSKTSGNVGSVSGRAYTFTGGYNYKYWLIPDGYNVGERVIERAVNDGVRVTFAYDSFYQYYQTNPTPSISVTYGIISIYGTPYRVYRTLVKSSLNYEQVVYSF